MTARQPDVARITLLTAIPDIVTQYAPLRAVLALAERVSASDAAVVICGEPGTGKSLVARLIHWWSPRAVAPLAEVRCAGASPRVLERELFGGDPAAPRGASTRSAGLLGHADGGTIFLQEVAALDGRVQAMLLHVLERWLGRRVGGAPAGATPVRVIASSSDDLGQRVADGSFHPGLFARLNTVRITLPPLRERIVDVRPLAEHFLRVGDGRRPPMLSADAVSALEAYRWPGNVRELRHVVQRAALVARDGIIRAAHLPLGRGVAPDPVQAGDALVSLEEVERRHIATVLEHVGWHQGRAAGILGISPKTLYRKMREYDLRRPGRPRRRTEREHTV